MEKALKAVRAMKDSFAVESKELLLSVGFFSLDQGQPGLWQRSASQEWREENEQGLAAQCVSSYKNQGPPQTKLVGAKVNLNKRKGFLLQWIEILPKG